MPKGNATATRRSFVRRGGRSVLRLDTRLHRFRMVRNIHMKLVPGLYCAQKYGPD